MHLDGKHVRAKDERRARQFDHDVDAPCGACENRLVRAVQTTEEADRRVGESERDPPRSERVFRHRARPPLIEMIRFIDVMKDRFGAEVVCRTMRAPEVGFE